MQKEITPYISWRALAAVLPLAFLLLLLPPVGLDVGFQLTAGPVQVQAELKHGTLLAHIPEFLPLFPVGGESGN